MIYRDFQDLHLSLLGFGTMRLPTTVDGAIDEDTTQAMVDYALAHGVNYFDTAWAYMQNLSETVVGRCLKSIPGTASTWPPNTPAIRSPATRTRRTPLPSSWRSVGWTTSISTCCTTSMKTT